MTNMRIARVFPRVTEATPRDALAFVDEPPLWGVDVDEVHVSVTFTWDLQKAEVLAKAWAKVAPVRIGGPATGERGGQFEPGVYLKQGWTITSRGCPNHCAHCLVPTRFGCLQELQIRPGAIIQDDNLLACSEAHIRAVFAMLAQYGSKAELRGMEARLLRDWHCELIGKLHPGQVFYACDTPEAIDPLRAAMQLMRDCEKRFGLHLAEQWRNRCYVLIGRDGETHAEAERRLREVYDAGFLPFAMLYRDEAGNVDNALLELQRQWSRPAITHRIMGKAKKNPEREASRLF